MAYKLNRVVKEEFYGNYIGDHLYRIEFTVTYNPRYMPDIAYADSLNVEVVSRIINFVEQNQQCEGDGAFLNYVIERHQNGFPHIHGTIFTENIIRPSSVHNLEKSLYRMYGATQVYCTGKFDKWHKNDHFEGNWQDYLHKEGIPIYIFIERVERNNSFKKTNLIKLKEFLNEEL